MSRTLNRSVKRIWGRRTRIGMNIASFQ